LDRRRLVPDATGKLEDPLMHDVRVLIHQPGRAMVEIGHVSRS
jgi:hypothetical protein